MSHKGEQKGFLQVIVMMHITIRRHCSTTPQAHTHRTRERELKAWSTRTQTRYVQPKFFDRRFQPKYFDRIEKTSVESPNYSAIYQLSNFYHNHTKRKSSEILVEKKKTLS